MRKRNEEEEKVYTTLDAYQAGFLTLKGHLPKLIEQGEKVVFLFKVKNTLYNDLTEYNCGALIEASKFAMAIKALKSQIISLKMDKGQRYVGKKEEGE